MNSIHPVRNGKPRLLSGNARAWQWTNYDSQGRPQKSRNTNAFAYDRRGQLTYAILNSTTNSYAYDLAGNRTASNDSILDPITWNANPLNQYTYNTDNTFSYDLDGNLTSINGDTTLFWDARNRLSAISNATYSATHTYDYRHRRTSSTISTLTSTTRHTFYYDDWNLIYEQVDIYDSASSSWTPTRTLEYFWGPDLSNTLQGAGGIGGLLAVSINNAFYFPCTDNIGNITAYVSESGATVATYEYDAFGNTLSVSGSLADIFSHRFSSKYHDLSTNLYYYGYRYYSPWLGRWSNRDPIEEEGGAFLYLFTENKPSYWIDDTGLLARNYRFDTDGFDGSKGRPYGTTHYKVDDKTYASNIVRRCNVYIESGHNGGPDGVLQDTINGEECSGWTIYSCAKNHKYSPAEPQQSPLLPNGNAMGITKKDIPRLLETNKGDLMAIITAYNAGTMLIPTFCKGQTNEKGCCSKVRLTLKCHIKSLFSYDHPWCNKTWIYDCKSNSFDKEFIPSHVYYEASKIVNDYIHNRR